MNQITCRICVKSKEDLNLLTDEFRDFFYAVTQMKVNAIKKLKNKNLTMKNISANKIRKYL